MLIIAYLWTAGSAEGVTGDEDRARVKAGDFIAGTGVGTVVTITRARYNDWLTDYSDHGPVARWLARRCPDGAVTWQRCTPAPGREVA